MPTVVLKVGDGVKKIDYKLRKGQGTAVKTGTVEHGETGVFNFTVYGYVEFTYGKNSDYIMSGYSTDTLYAVYKFPNGNEYDTYFNSPDTEDISVNISVYAKIVGWPVKYVWGDGATDGPPDGIKYKDKTYYIPAKTPKRTGYVFRYWVDNLGTPKQWRPGDAYTRNGSVTFTAVWSKKYYFYWHGSDSNDNEYFQKDKPVDEAITASGWNALCEYVNVIRRYCWIDEKEFNSVSAGNEISASGFNEVSKAIQDCVDKGWGISPPTVSAGSLIKTTDYNGTRSIKAAANSVMYALE